MPEGLPLWDGAAPACATGSRGRAFRIVLNGAVAVLVRKNAISERVVCLDVKSRQDASTGFLVKTSLRAFWCKIAPVSLRCPLWATDSAERRTRRYARPGANQGHLVILAPSLRYAPKTGPNGKAPSVYARRLLAV